MTAQAFRTIGSTICSNRSSPPSEPEPDSVSTSHGKCAKRIRPGLHTLAISAAAAVSGSLSPIRIGSPRRALRATMSKRALIVDDEPDIRELLEITLGRMDIETKAANDVRTATELLATHEFDLCLTDMHLPDGDGIELVRRINADHPGLPVAVITAYGN